MLLELSSDFNSRCRIAFINGNGEDGVEVRAVFRCAYGNRALLVDRRSGLLLSYRKGLSLLLGQGRASQALKG